MIKLSEIIRWALIQRLVSSYEKTDRRAHREKAT